MAYVGFAGVKFSATLEHEQKVRPGLVKSTLLRLAGAAIVMGVFMDFYFKTYGLFITINGILVSGSFLFSVALNKHKFEKNDDE
jgi:hypothetical protein